MSKRKNIMTAWREFNPMAEKTMKDDFQKEPSPLFQKIIAYLNNGEVILASPSCAVDVFSGEKINQTNCILTDGEFSWSNALVHYVEKYNLQLPKELEEKIKTHG